MKRIITGLLIVLMAAAAAVPVYAGAFDEFYESSNEDGTYTYYFTQGLTVTMDEYWYQHTFISTEEGTAAFYHKESYNRFEQEGTVGGKLFSLGGSVNTDFQNLPAFIYVGFDVSEMMNYYASLPTDYQAYASDGAVRDEYDKLWEGVGTVIEGIEILGKGNIEIPADRLAGGWNVPEDMAVPQEVADALAGAAAEGKTYTPTAVLGTQSVAGTNYCLLCQTVSEEKPGILSYSVVYVYLDLEGNAQILQEDAVEIGLR